MASALLKLSNDDAAVVQVEAGGHGEVSGIVGRRSGCGPALNPGMTRTEDTLADGSCGAEDERLAFEPGQALGRYVTLELLGIGGMGQVFCAYDTLLDRKVALKVLRYPSGEDRTRLVREAQALARVSHPNVVSVYDVGEVDGEVFIAMELVEGCNLREWLRAPDRTAEQILTVFRAAARGLQAAHGAGIVHRDFKPDNVLLGRDGRVCVTDFGLALRAGDAQPSTEVEPSANSGSERLTETGMVMGTPAYMPIEQHLGLPTDVRSDQFSFCVALYEALYRVRPFKGETGRELVLAIKQGEFRGPGSSDVPRSVHAAIVRGLSPRAGDRFASMLELRSALRPQARRFEVSWALGLVGVLLGAVAMGIGGGALEVPSDVAQAEQGIGSALQGVAMREAVVVTHATTAADCEAAFGTELGARMLCLDRASRARRVATTAG